MDRRTLLRGAAAAGIASAAPLIGPANAANAATTAFPNPLQVLKYRLLVPEIFRALPDAPAHSTALVIGSGFGASVAALRLAQAGVRTTVLERGSRWPFPSPTREIFSPDAIPDGRAVWRQSSGLSVGGVKLSVDYFGGVLDTVTFDGMQVICGAGVGGGSLVYTGVLLVPDQQKFQHLFGTTVPWAQMAATYYPRAAAMLGASTMPDDIYASSPYTHSRIWDQQAAKAGLTPQRIPGVWDWDVMRRELRGTVRRSATVSESNYGNSNGVKRGLGLTYLAQAEATGLATVYPGHEVLSISRQTGGGYAVTVRKVAPTGDVLSTRTLTSDRLFLAAGSIGTTELLMRARAHGTLPQLDDNVGTGWGGNGDAFLFRSYSLGGLTQGAASASRISSTVNGLPVTLENWMVPGLPVNLGVIASLGMTFDETRADFGWNSSADALSLRWPGQPDSDAALRATNATIASAAGVQTGAAPFVSDIQSSFTAHPLGGMVIGRATDAYGRVNNHPGLYVIDGSLVPGNAGAVNPTLTITALAERNIAQIIADRG